MSYAKLKDRSVLVVTGDDATGFLQNILTCDVDEVGRIGAGYGALLTPQGKIISDFLIFPQPSGYQIDVRCEAVKALAGRLQLYKLRANVNVAEESDLAVFASREGAATDQGFVDPRLAELGRRMIAPAEAINDLVDEEDWHAHRIALAVPEGGVDFLFNEAFPHDAAMDCLHGIAFDKGCYVGQEVVSRMRHRGTARRRIVSVSGVADLPGPGTDLTADGQPIGRLGSSIANRGVGLVRLDRAARARNVGMPIYAGKVAVTLSIPTWATYDWPPDEAGE